MMKAMKKNHCNQEMLNKSRLKFACFFLYSNFLSKVLKAKRKTSDLFALKITIINKYNLYEFTAFICEKKFAMLLLK
jgi:hypothetical protein